MITLKQHARNNHNYTKMVIFSNKAKHVPSEEISIEENTNNTNSMRNTFEKWSIALQQPKYSIFEVVVPKSKREADQEENETQLS